MNNNNTNNWNNWLGTKVVLVFVYALLVLHNTVFCAARPHGDAAGGVAATVADNAVSLSARHKAFATAIAARHAAERARRGLAAADAADNAKRTADAPRLEERRRKNEAELLAEIKEISSDDKEALGEKLLVAASRSSLTALNALPALIAKGVDLNFEGIDQYAHDETALTIAAGRGATTFLKALIEAGADVNHVTAKGQNALSVIGYYGHSGDELGQTPRGCAWELIEAGIALPSRDNPGLYGRLDHHELENLLQLIYIVQTPSLPAGYIIVGTEWDMMKRIEWRRGNKAFCEESLLRAAEQGYLGALSMIIKNGNVNLEVQDSAGSTAVQLAAVNGHIDCVKALLAAGASTDLGAGATPDAQALVDRCIRELNLHGKLTAHLKSKTAIKTDVEDFPPGIAEIMAGYVYEAPTQQKPIENAGEEGKEQEKRALSLPEQENRLEHEVTTPEAFDETIQAIKALLQGQPGMTTEASQLNYITKLVARVLATYIAQDKADLIDHVFAIYAAGFDRPELTALLQSTQQVAEQTHPSTGKSIRLTAIIMKLRKLIKGEA